MEEHIRDRICSFSIALTRQLGIVHRTSVRACLASFGTDNGVK